MSRMTALDRPHRRRARRCRGTGPGRAPSSPPPTGKQAAAALAAGDLHPARPVGRAAGGPHGAARRAGRRHRRASASLPPTAASPPSAGTIRRRSGSSGRSRDLFGLTPTAARRPALARPWPLGPQPAAGRDARTDRHRPPTPSCRSRAKACTRSRSGRCMPASSSPAISASPPMARPWCGWRSGWAMPTRASRALMAGAALADAAQLAGAHLGRQHGRLRARLRPRRRGRARRRSAAARAVWLRALMAELERLANHLGDIGAICNDAAFALMHAHCARAARARAARRRRRLRPPADARPHRARRRRARPRRRQARGDPRARSPTIARDVSRPGRALRQHRLAAGPHRRHRHARSRSLPANSAPAALSAAPRAAPSTRASVPGYAPYDALAFEVPVLDDGDVNARVWIRIREVEQSLALIEQIARRSCPQGPVLARAAGAAEPARAWRWSRVFAATSWSGCGSRRTARVARCHLRDPSWFQWPLLEAAIEGNIVADFPLCNKSFNCSYSGHDL